MTQTEVRCCNICGEPLEPSQSPEFATCPKWHGKLVPALSTAQRKACEIARYKRGKQTGKGRRATVTIEGRTYRKDGRQISAYRAIVNRGKRRPRDVAVLDGRLYFIIPETGGAPAEEPKT
jgi:hypothetical protein